MAVPLTPDQALAALRAEGVHVAEHGDWRHHNRNEKGAWGPVHGVMDHHTASRPGSDIVDLCYRGRADLPGPLCHIVITKSGGAHLVGWGRTNHAGAGSKAALDAVIDERALPAVGPDEVDGNAHFYGIEIENEGTSDDPYPPEQLDAVARVNAALCRAHGWHAASVIGHKEWTRRKIDPRGFAMADMRSRVEERLRHPASWSPPAPAPKPPAPAPKPPATRTTEQRLADLERRVTALEHKG